MKTEILDVPNPDPIAPPGLGELAGELLGWLKWGVIVSGVLGIFICALMLIIGRRNRSATAYEGLVGSAWVIGGLALASVAALLVGAFQI
ncbi:hypothetical protein [Pseudonocardia sp.]|uniref:hypothetical protein n=1 Tax=Pseudonocardia sp. TaxID=60912 RepID=UPI003D0C25E3